MALIGHLCYGMRLHWNILFGISQRPGEKVFPFKITHRKHKNRQWEIICIPLNIPLKEMLLKLLLHLSCICLFNKDLLSVYYRPGDVLNMGTQQEARIDVVPVLNSQ